MNVKTRLSLQFAVIVAGILLLFSFSIYLSSSNFRKQQFFTRLADRAITTAKLLIEVKEVDIDLLKIIDRNTVILVDEKIQIYDYHNQIIYVSTEFDTTFYPLDFLNQIRIEKEVHVSEKKREVIGLIYSDTYNRFVVIASAYDKYGLGKIRNLKIVLLIVFLIAMLLSVFAGLFYAGRALLPISKVIQQVSRITANKLDLRVDEGNRKDELAQLAITFNNMLNRLQSAFEIQKSFVSNASHELKTPLTALSGQIEVALLKERSKKEYTELLYSLSEDIRGLTVLTNGLLDLAKYSSDLTLLQIYRFRIDECIISAQEELEKNNPDFLVLFNFKQLPDDESKLLMMGDEKLIRLVFLNLMENACKFSANKSVNVVLDMSIGHFEIHFIDKGMGIGIEDMKRIYEPFYRGENSIQKKGYGIGLSLVKKIIEIHQGEIFIESELNVGTRVKVLLNKSRT